MENGSKKIRMSLRSLSKKFYIKHKKSDLNVVQDISLDVYQNEFLVVFGPGLCGKTVLLNMMSGLEQPTSGEIFIDGEKTIGTSPKVSMVFQKLALLPWKTVMQNVEVGLKSTVKNKKQRRIIAQRYIDLVGLSGFEKAYPNQLSGGMKQRVGIARAYAGNPEILILDEPFGQLDAQTRILMQIEIQRIWEEEKKTIVFVTNNIEEALYLGDRIVLLTKCPAQIRQIFNIDFARPRDVMDPGFIKKRIEISEQTDMTL